MKLSQNQENTLIKLWKDLGIESDFINECLDWYLVTNGALSANCPEGFETTLKVGDTVEWVNDYGVTFSHRIIGFAINDLCQYNPDQFVFLQKDSFWHPIRLSAINQ